MPRGDYDEPNLRQIPRPVGHPKSAHSLRSARVFARTPSRFPLLLGRCGLTLGVLFSRQHRTTISRKLEPPLPHSRSVQRVGDAMTSGSSAHALRRTQKRRFHSNLACWRKRRCAGRPPSRMGRTKRLFFPFRVLVKRRCRLVGGEFKAPHSARQASLTLLLVTAHPPPPSRARLTQTDGTRGATTT